MPKTSKADILAVSAEATDEIAGAIVSLADGVRALRSGRLNEKALLLLIQYATPSNNRVTQGQIKAVLDAIEGLKEQYLK
jgi:hypothetical protein